MHDIQHIPIYGTITLHGVQTFACKKFQRKCLAYYNFYYNSLQTDVLIYAAFWWVGVILLASIQQVWAQEQYAHFIHAWQVQVGIWSVHLRAVRNLIRPAIAAMLRRAAPFTMLLELQCVLPLERIDGHAMLNMFASTHIWFAK
jgi:hypothetical protein